MTRLIGTIELRQAVKGDTILLLVTELPVSPVCGKTFILEGWTLKYTTNKKYGWECLVMGRA
jgi:hypothetical protein